METLQKKQRNNESSLSIELRRLRQQVREAKEYRDQQQKLTDEAISLMNASLNEYREENESLMKDKALLYQEIDDLDHKCQMMKRKLQSLEKLYAQKLAEAKKDLQS